MIDIEKPRVKSTLEPVDEKQEKDLASTENIFGANSAAAGLGRVVFRLFSSRRCPQPADDSEKLFSSEVPQSQPDDPSPEMTLPDINLSACLDADTPDELARAARASRLAGAINKNGYATAASPAFRPTSHLASALLLQQYFLEPPNDASGGRFPGGARAPG